MEIYLISAQLIISLSVFYVWTFRNHNVVKEFIQFNLSDLTRSLVGAIKIALSTILILGIWFPNLVFISSIIMGLFMIAAQLFHIKIKNPLTKHLPSFFLLILCAFTALGSFL